MVVVLGAQQMKILIPVEDADLANVQLDFVLSHHWPEPTSFNILNVLHHIYKVSEEASAEHRHAAELVKNIAHKIQESLTKSGVTISVAEGRTVEAILKVASEWESDLIVLASHGRHGVGHAVLGSVAYDVLSQSPCKTIMLGLPAKAEAATKPVKETIDKLRFAKG